MSQKWVVFDFCETLVNIQTGDAFIDFAIKGHNSSFRKFWKLTIDILEKLRLFSLSQKLAPKYNLEKRMRLYLLKDISEKDLEIAAKEFVEQVLIKFENRALIQKLNKHILEKDRVCISSGGFSIYLKYWADKHNIEWVDACEIQFRNGKCTGLLLGKDCMFEEKTNRLDLKKSSDENLSNLERVVYSDSITDLPLFKWSHIPYVISYENPRNWVKKYSLNEIIIGRNNGGLEI